MSIFKYSYLNHKFYKHHHTFFFPNSLFCMEETLIQASTGYYSNAQAMQLLSPL